MDGLDVLARAGISSEGLSIKAYTDLPDMTFDYLITVCDRVHEPGLPEALAYRHCIHWSMVDPDELALEPDQFLLAMDTLCAEIRQRITLFVHRLAGQDVGQPDVS